MSKIPELERRATKARSKRAGVKMQDLMPLGMGELLDRQESSQLTLRPSTRKSTQRRECPLFLWQRPLC